MHESSIVAFGCLRGSTFESASQDAPGSTIVRVRDSGVRVFSTSPMAGDVFGGLIQTAVGSGRGTGQPLGNRSGFFANASTSTRARRSCFAAARP